jgi:hypothetical protein
VRGQFDGRWKSGEEVYNKVYGYCHEIGVVPVIKGRAFPPQAYGAFVRHGPLAMPSAPGAYLRRDTIQA